MCRRRTASTSKRNEDCLFICLSTIYVSELAGYSPKSDVLPPHRFACETQTYIYMSLYQLYTSTKWLDIVRNGRAAAAIVFNYIYIRPFHTLKMAGYSPNLKWLQNGQIKFYISLLINLLDLIKWLGIVRNSRLFCPNLPPFANTGWI